MPRRIRVLLQTILAVAVAVIGFSFVRSNNRVQEIAGAVLLVMLVGWSTVMLSRARQRLVK
jgi:hypothetical protein